VRASSRLLSGVSGHLRPSSGTSCSPPVRDSSVCAMLPVQQSSFVRYWHSRDLILLLLHRRHDLVDQCICADGYDRLRHVLLDCVTRRILTFRHHTADDVTIRNHAESAGLRDRPRGFAADTRLPVFPELRGLIDNTAGVVLTFRMILRPFAARIAFAFVYGSVAPSKEITTLTC
jgi:hypothetical protein